MLEPIDHSPPAARSAHDMKVGIDFSQIVQRCEIANHGEQHGTDRERLELRGSCLARYILARAWLLSWSDTPSAQAARSGLGFAVLPMPIAADAGPVPLFGPVSELARTCKLLTHPAWRPTPKVAAFFDFVERERTLVSKIFSKTDGDDLNRLR